MEVNCEKFYEKIQISDDEHWTRVFGMSDKGT